MITFGLNLKPEIMNKKTLSIISYITIIGWVIAYVNYNKLTVKDSLTRFHLKQGLGIAILGIAISVALTIIAVVVPTLASILSLVNLVVLVLWIMGIINANNEQEIPVPVVGKLFTDKFDFIK
ncbi:import component protein [Flavobacteriaceae bacterium CRH]|nr:import component protein [Flavobacteriaceae bacterium CRH]